MKISPVAFLPECVRTCEKKHRGMKPWLEWREGTVLFADVSGFTPLSESLSVLGAEGAEILNTILNRYFADLIGIVHSFGGQVMKFGGDAILCFFPGQDPIPAVLYAARKMQLATKKYKRIKTPVKLFSLNLKIGIAAGEILLAGVGDPRVRREMVFAGGPVDLTSDAEHLAKAGDIVLACSPECLPTGLNGLEEISSGFYLVRDAIVVPEVTVRSGNDMDPTIIGPYVNREILAMVNQGLERFIGILQSSLPVFLRFSGFRYEQNSFDLFRFNDFFSTVMDITHRYHGRLNHISMGDKGSTFFLLFGAPVPLEKKEELACSWALTVIETIDMQFPEVTLGIGMNVGRIFSGIVGGSDRYDFTSLGDAVNFAARLMQKARPSQILISGSVYQTVKDTYHCDYLGDQKFKGKTGLIPVYRLQSRKKYQGDTPDNDFFVGRSDEQKRLLTLLEHAVSGNPTIAVLMGDAGVGKSSIARQMLHLATQRDWNVFLARGDVTRHSHVYGPWHDCLQDLFFGGIPPTEQGIRKLLEKYNEYNEQSMRLFSNFYQILPKDCPETIEDENFRKRQQRLLVSLFLKRVKNVPTVIFFDDLHWFDSLSLELLIALLDQSRREPLFFLATTRPEWSSETLPKRSYCHLMTITEMATDNIRPLAEHVLGGPVRADLIDVLDHHTRGNPFFLHQFIEYLQKNGLLETRLGQWTIKKGIVIEKTLTGEEIVISKIERLSPREKIHIRFASCIGTIFRLAVLRTAMGRLFHAGTWRKLCDDNFFTPLEDKDIWSFHHAIIQDAIYQSNTQRVRRNCHYRIGQAIEMTQADSLEQWYPNLSNHYFLAQSRNKAIYYAVEAGLRLAKDLMYLESCRFLERGYHLLQYTSDQRKWKIAVKLSWIYLKLGRLDDSLELSKKVMNRAKKLHKYTIFFRACINQYEAMALRSDYSYVHALQKILAHPAMKQPFRNDFLFHLAVAYEKRGNIARARTIFGKIARQRKKYRDERTRRYAYLTIIPALHRQAVLARQDGNLLEAVELLDRALPLAKETRNSDYELVIEMERATLLMDEGNYQKAMQVYEDLIARCEEFGNLSLLGICFLNRGDLLLSLDDVNSAALSVQEAMAIFTRLGYEVGIGNALNLLGFIAFRRREYTESYRLYCESVLKFEKIHQQQETIMGYYNLAEVCAELGRFVEARSWMRKFQQAGPSLPAALFAQSSNELASIIERKESEQNRMDRHG